MADILNELVVTVSKFHVVFKTNWNFGILVNPLEVKIFLPEFIFIFLGGNTGASLLISLRLLSCCCLY